MANLDNFMSCRVIKGAIYILHIFNKINVSLGIISGLPYFHIDIFLVRGQNGFLKGVLPNFERLRLGYRTFYSFLLNINNPIINDN